MNCRLIAIFALSTAALGFPAESGFAQSKQSQYSQHEDTPLYETAPIEDIPFSIHDLKRVLATGKIQSIEELLSALPAPMRKQYVLMHTSRSIQQASPLSPRAILVSPKGGLVLTFNGGDPTLAGHQNVELMQFDEAKSEFYFHDLEFQAGGKPHMSGRNPEKCLKCHGSQYPHPIWESYDFWPGAYGETDDEPDKDFPAIAPFLKTLPGHPRFSKLDPLSYAHSEKSFRYRGSPASSVTHWLYNWQFRAIVKRLREHPEWNQIKHLALGVMSNCYMLGSPYSPPHAEGALVSREELRAEVIRAREGLPRTTSFYRFSSEEYSFYRLLLKKLFPGETDWWPSMSLKGREVMITPLISEQELSFWLTRGDRELESLKCDLRGDTSPIGDNRLLCANSCAQIREIAASRASQIKKPALPCESAATHPATQAVGHARDLAQSGQIIAEKLFQPPAAAKRCAECHSTNAGIGPLIPFEQVEALSQFIRSRPGLIDDVKTRINLGIHEKGHMPPGEMLSAPEKAAFIKYLDELK